MKSHQILVQNTITGDIIEDNFEGHMMFIYIMKNISSLGVKDGIKR